MLYGFIYIERKYGYFGSGIHEATKWTVDSRIVIESNSTDKGIELSMINSQLPIDLPSDSENKHLKPVTQDLPVIDTINPIINQKF